MLVDLTSVQNFIPLGLTADALQAAKFGNFLQFCYFSPGLAPTGERKLAFSVLLFIYVLFSLSGQGGSKCEATFRQKIFTASRRNLAH